MAAAAHRSGHTLVISARTEQDGMWIERQLAHALQAAAVELGLEAVRTEVIHAAS